MIALGAPAVATAAPDPMLAQQWALSNPAAMGAAEAWTQASGDGVLVAVLDTGVQLDHPDLAGAIWRNPGEIAGNGRDDDANGFVDDVHGANTFASNGDVDDDNGHGTHVAGIVAARQGNGIGGSGIAPGAQVMAVKVLDSNMGGPTDGVARGIRYAVDKGARIINVSINGDVATPALTGAVKHAGQRGAIVVASAGNNGRNIDVLQSFPASLTIREPNVVSVAATDQSGRLWQRSNTGLLAVDIAAPGQQIVGPTRGSAYQSRTGTSAAAPLVAGAMALIAQARSDLSMGQVRDVLVDTARRTNLLTSLIGGGGLDVGAAMHGVLEGRPWNTSTRSVSTAARPTLRLKAKATVRARSRVTLRWTATGADTVTTWRVSLNGKVVAKLATTAAGVSRKVSKVGRNSWRVVGLAADGTKVVTATRAFKVTKRR